MKEQFALHFRFSSRANASEINGIASRTVTTIKTSGTDDPVVSTLNGTLEKDNNNLTVSIARKMASDATPLVQLLKSRRKKGIQSLFKNVESACNRLNPEVESAGKKLKEVIKRHGSNMYSLAHDQLTSGIDSLFKEFEEPALVAALELTGSAIIVAESKEANRLYLAELGKRENDDAKKEDPQLVGENSKKVKDTLDQLMNYLDACLAAKENAVLKTLYAELSGIFDQANAVIKARNTRKKNGGNGNGTPPVEPANK